MHSRCENPDYGKLHVGLFIAAMEDAMDRALQLSEEVKKREGAGNTASASGSRHGRNAPDSGNGDLFSTW